TRYQIDRPPTTAMTTLTMIAGMRVCDDFGGSRSCVSFGASADETCVTASGVCTLIVFLRAVACSALRLESFGGHNVPRQSWARTRNNLWPRVFIESAHGRQRPALCFPFAHPRDVVANFVVACVEAHCPRPRCADNRPRTTHKIASVCLIVSSDNRHGSQIGAAYFTPPAENNHNEQRATGD